MSPSVSLITTVYNRERYLSETIESILTQTYPDFELLIWDDGSTDDSVEIAQYYAAQDPRIRVVAADHKGRAPALKAAVAATTGTYIGLVDSDDLLAQTALEETVIVLDRQSTVGLVYTDYIVISETGAVKEYGVRCRTPYSRERLLIDFMVFHFRLMRRSVYDQVGGFDERFECCQDYELCLRLSEVADFLQLKRPLYYYRHHKNSISGQKRVEQIQWSTLAVQEALQRRGLADQYEVEVQIFARFSLLKKQPEQKTAEHSALDVAQSPSLFNVALIETHNRCTRRCWFCKFGQERQDPTEQTMSDETLLKIAHNLQDLNYAGRISPFGINEPLLDPRIVDIIRLFHSKCPKAFLSFNTNGDRLTEPLLEQLFDAGLTTIGISIYDNLGFKRLAHYANDSRVALIDMRQPDHRLENRGGQIQVNGDRFHPEQVMHLPCDRPFNMLVICPAGTVVLCCSDMYGDVVMGDVQKSRLETIWFSEVFNAYRRQLINQGRGDLKLCQNCSHRGGTSTVQYPLPEKEDRLDTKVV